MDVKTDIKRNLDKNNLYQGDIQVMFDQLDHFNYDRSSLDDKYFMTTTYEIKHYYFRYEMIVKQNIILSATFHIHNKNKKEEIFKYEKDTINKNKIHIEPIHTFMEDLELKDKNQVTFFLTLMNGFTFGDVISFYPELCLWNIYDMIHIIEDQYVYPNQ